MSESVKVRSDYIMGQNTSITEYISTHNTDNNIVRGTITSQAKTEKKVFSGRITQQLQ